MTHQPNKVVRYGFYSELELGSCLNLLICLEACKAELKRQSVVGKLKTTQTGKGLLWSALGTFSHTMCSTPHQVLCIICSSLFVSFMEVFHNVYVAATAPKGSLSPSPQ